MKKALLLLAALPILLAAPARADVDQFASDIDNLGISSPAPGRIGREICSDLITVSASAEASDLYNSSVYGQGRNNSITLQQARQEVAYAISDLCPDE